ncbi:MAG: NAD(P)-dependent glycerol-1-phosphate dehydrogenase [Candidatus Asgardarchaeia archaeon]
MTIDIMEIPRYVIMGENATSLLPKIIKNIGAKKILLLSGKKSTKKIAKEVVLPYLKDFSAELNPIESSVDYQAIMEIYNNAKNKEYDALISVGGGSIIDCGKVAASWLDIPFISYPTAASHDGISSPSISFLLREDIRAHKKDTNIVKSPVAIIADTKIISRAPKRLLIAGFGDMIAKYTAVLDWRLAHKLRNEPYSEYAASMALMSAKIVRTNIPIIKHGGERAARVITKALIGSGVSMAIAGNSRPASGAEHLFSHALDLLSKKYGFKNALHGEQCGVGSIVAAYLHGRNWKSIKRALKAVGAPTTARELGIPDKYLVEALSIAHTIRPERYTILGDNGISRDAAKKALIITGIIKKDYKE